jgi:hypothetical protein
VWSQEQFQHWCKTQAELLRIIIAILRETNSRLQHENKTDGFFFEDGYTQPLREDSIRKVCLERRLSVSLGLECRLTGRNNEQSIRK